MKKPGSSRRLPQVLQAIEDLGDIQHGSSTKKILGQLQSSGSSSPGWTAAGVKKALKSAVDNGLVSERAGKFALAKSSKKGKKSIEVDTAKSIISECRRRRRSRHDQPRRSRSRRGRRRHASLSNLSDSAAPALSEDYHENRSLSRSRSRTPIPMNSGVISHRHHRRRHRRERRSRSRRRRQRGRGRRQHSFNDDENPEYRRLTACQVEETKAEDKHLSYIN